MKKIFYLLLAVLGCSVLTACEDDAWGNGDPAMEHIYYVGFQDWGKLKNDVVFNVVQGETVAIPVQFWCEFIRPYDVVTFYYTAGSLVAGVDYQVVDANGAALTPDANGAYTIIWPEAKKGVQNVYIKALQGAKGSLTVQTHNPNSELPIVNDNLESTVNNRTADYEVRNFTQNYKVTVNIK